MLISPVTEKEVKKILFYMYPDKSLGPDVITPGFYQKYWKIVGQDVVDIVQSFFDTCTINPHVILTNVALVPKKKKSTIVFVPGRLMTDNIMVVHELMHFMQKKLRENKLGRH